MMEVKLLYNMYHQPGAVINRTTSEFSTTRTFTVEGEKVAAITIKQDKISISGSANRHHQERRDWI